MTREQLFRMHEETCKAALETMKAKNQDYTNGRDPFQNFRSASFFGVYPEIGLLMRCLDKFQRIRSFCENGTLAVANESVEDAIEDVINYMILLKGLAQEERPEPVKKEVKVGITNPMIKVPTKEEALTAVKEINDRLESMANHRCGIDCGWGCLVK